MDLKLLEQKMAELNQLTADLENLYMENEGEVTEETLQFENRVLDLQDLLSTEGIDMLGAWLKAKEDRKKALKAEKDYITRQMAATDETIDFIKHEISRVMSQLGLDKVKGNRGYTFSAYTSTKTEVDKETLRETYAGKAEKAIRKAGIPEYVGVSLTASATKFKELGAVEGDEKLFLTVENDTVKFTKPRASKES